MAILATLGLTGCAQQQPSAEPARPVFLGAWHASTNAKATITFSDDGTWSASDGCNRMGEKFTADGEEFDSPVGPNSTRRYCSNQVDYQRIVPEVARIEVEGDNATMVGNRGDVLLALVREKSD